MNYFIKFIILIACTLTAFKASSCECPVLRYANWVPVVERSIDRVPHIFMGRIVNSTKTFYNVEVVDVFKGKIKPDSVVSIDSEVYCSDFPEGLAIFYADTKNDSILVLNACGLSRSLEKFSSSVPPPPPPTGFKGDTNEYYEKQIKQLDIEMQPLLLNNWINEYALLNAYRNSHQKVQEPQGRETDYLSYLALALSLVAVFAAFFRKRP